MQFKEWFCENCEQELLERNFLGRLGSMMGADDHDSWVSKAGDFGGYMMGRGGDKSYAAYRAAQGADRRQAVQDELDAYNQAKLAGTKDDPAIQQRRADAIEQAVKASITNLLKGKLTTFTNSQRNQLAQYIKQISNAFATGYGAQASPALEIAKIVYDNPNIDDSVKARFAGPSRVFRIFQNTILLDTTKALWYDKDGNQPFIAMDFDMDDLKPGMEDFRQHVERGKTGDDDPRTGPDMTGVDWDVVNDGDSLNPTKMVIGHIQSMAAEGRYGMDDIIRIWNGFANSLRDEARRKGKRINVSAMTRDDYNLMEPYSIPRPRRRP